MSDPGWTDITSTNSLATVVLEGLGYEPEVKTLSVPVAFEALKTNDIDVFLGNWMPSHEKFRAELEAADAVDVIVQNLEGAKFTLAAPSYAGIDDFADLAEHAEALDSSIYGIEPGAVANQNMQRMIEANDFGLAGWKVVESSEQAMLSQVQRAVDAQEPIVFLAWAPHPMNTKFDLTYLAGGDEYFGPNYGGAQVYTLSRKGFAAECPNLGKFFTNLVFTVDMENQMMGKILDEGMAGPDAAEAWLMENPGVLDAWLDGVTTLGGEPGLPAVKESLGL
jgi:glycine betaine/proline transport system substrate-binding protein